MCSSDAPDAMDMWRHHYARANREETHPMHGNPFQTASTLAEISGEASSSSARQEWGQTPGTKSVQAGKCICSPKLGKKRRDQEDPSSSIPHPDNGILGYRHLTLTRHFEHITHSYPLPLPPKTSQASGQPLRGQQGWCSLMSKDNGGYHSNISACSGCHVSYHHWWYLIFFYFLWLDSCNVISRVDIWWWIDIF